MSETILQPTILTWCGRFGNNIQQISNAIFFCKENSFNFNSPDNDLINPFIVEFGNEFTHSGIYFFNIASEIGDGLPDFIVDNYKLEIERREICKDIIYDKLKIDFNNVKELENDNLIIHIRSGDIFSRENYYCPVVSNYIQNPLSYYLNIIKDFKKIIVLTEDNLNPVINELCKIDKVEIKILPIKETIELMLSAKNLVTSGVSSFPIACALLSKNLKKLYCSNLYLNEVLNYKNLINTDVEVIITNIDQERYIKWNEWMNTEEQRKLILNYEDINS